jgi:DNA-binding response OmpR family regulator
LRQTIIFSEKLDRAKSLAIRLNDVGLHNSVAATRDSFFSQLSSPDKKVLILIASSSAGESQTLSQLGTVSRREISNGLIVLLTENTLVDRLDFYDAGADLILPENVNILELTARHNTLLKRVNHSKWANHIHLKINGNTALINDKCIKLSPTETKILEFLCKNEYRVVTRNELINILNKDTNSRSLINVHLHNLRKKFLSAGQQHIITTISGKGYKLNC